MNLLSLKLENCFGIGKLEHEFDFDKSNSYVIYAPNGTMKSSFAKTLDLISKNDPKNQPRDDVYDRKSKFEIYADSVQISNNSILVINAEDNTFDGSSKISSFIASKDLKERYESAYDELNNSKSDLIKKLKSISKSNNCEEEYVGTFRENYNENFIEILQKKVDDLTDDSDKIRFRYNDVFDPKENVKKFLKKNETLLEDYIVNYNNIISNSRLFKLSSENNFGTYQANEIIKSIEDNAYFDAGHTFVLEDGTEIKNSQELKELYQEELDKILADEKLKKSFETVDKAIGANVELRNFKKVIEEDNSLLVKLKDYDKFKQEVWTSYLSEIKEDALALSQLYENKKIELATIISEAQKEIALWNDIIKKFNSRFYVPFKISITNQKDMILKQETANLEFIYSDNKESSVKQTKDNLLKVLSKGEQRAYFILQFLFEIESRNLSEDTTLVVFDDIADSFDYKNKYAIIEYIRDLHLSSKFRSLILTHNFDFYRTLASRLALNNQSFMATKDENRRIDLKLGLYTEGIFKEYLKNPDDPKIFITLIPFVRNLIEYSDSSKTDDYKTLTSCLHDTELSGDTTVEKIKNIFKNRITKLNDKEFSFTDETNISEFIFSTADGIIGEENINEILLENKVCLAIACRLKMERFLIAKLPGIDLSKYKYNPTRALSNEYKNRFATCETLPIIDKVNLMTPENIHLNAFMYEPLIDMSVYHLMDLYKEIKSLE